jgi:hypothetical protein
VPQLSAEAVLISSLLNNHDVACAATYGIRPDHFIGYKDEYNWLVRYTDEYGSEPTWDAFKVAWPSFIRSEHEDTRSACDMVLKAYGKRTLTEAMSSAFDSLAVGDLDVAYKTLIAAEPRRAHTKPKRLLTDTSFLDNWDEEQPYVELPYRTLQRHTGGIRPGNICYFSARPGQGKTAHLTNIVKHAVLTGNRVLFYSLEMSEAEVRARFHAALATHFGYKGITLNDIRDRRVDLHTYKTFVGELDDRLQQTGGHLDIHTPRDGVTTPGLVASRASEYHLNVVDYIGLMRADSGSRSVDDWRVAASISNDLKSVGLNAHTGMLVATQINRDGDSGKEPPKLKHMSQTDALGQDGDMVVTMRAMPHNVATAFSLEKNRHGQSGIKFFTTFNPNEGMFDEISAEQAEDMQIRAEEGLY